MRLAFPYIVIIILCCYLLYKKTDYTHSENIVYAWTTELKTENDTIVFHFLCKEKHRQSKARIYDIENNVVDSFLFSANKNEVFDELQWRNGIVNADKHKYESKLKPGLYFIENKSSFIVPNKEAEIIIVVPHVSKMANNRLLNGTFYQELDGNVMKKSSFYRKDIDSASSLPFVLSYNRPFEDTIHYSSFVYKAIKELISENLEVGFISDMDISKNLDEYKKTKTLIFAGDFTFMENGVYTALSRFLETKGNIMIASSLFMNYRVRLNREENTIVFYNRPKNDPVKEKSVAAIGYNDPESNEWNYSLMGADYSLAGKSKSKFLKIDATDHPFFKKLTLKQGDSIAFDCTSMSGIPVLNNRFYDSYANIDSLYYAASLPCEKGNGGIGIIQRRKNEGKVICLGTENWFDSKNIERDTVQQILKNALEVLLDK